MGDLHPEPYYEPRIYDALSRLVCLVCGAALEQPKTGRRRLTCSDRCRTARARGAAVGPCGPARHETVGGRFVTGELSRGENQ
jgi:hypothetical protein